MKYSFIVMLLMSVMILSCTRTTESFSLNYPKIDKEISIDTIGKSIIIDPYRNLENIKDDQIQSWFLEQDKLTDSLVALINADNTIYDSVIKIESRARDTEIIERYKYLDNGSYYILKRNKDQKIARLFFKKNISSEPVQVFDPASIGDDLAINYFQISPDYNKLAIALSEKGKEESQLLILETKSGKILPNSLSNVTPDLIGGTNWLPDSSGFFYIKFPHLDPKDPSYLENSKTFLHRLDQPQEMDEEVFSIGKTPEIPLTQADFPIVQTRKNNPNLLIGRVSGNTPYKDVYFSKISDQKSIHKPLWKPLFKQSDKIDQYLIVNDTLFYRTSKTSSNFKICKALIGSDYAEGIVLIENKDDAVINDFALIKNGIYYTTIKNGVEAQLFHKKNNKEVSLKLPFPAGSISIRAVKENLMVNIRGWLNPSENYLFNTKSQEFMFVDPQRVQYPEFDNFIVEEVKVLSHDGLEIPLSIIRSQNSKLDSSNRVKLNAYGAYGDSSSPYLEISLLNWVRAGNIYAVAHVRGGGEKGDAWHMGGFKTTKSNSWKDFISCTEYLIDKKYTNPDLITAFGVSAGGITIANALIERPDLYRVGILYSPFINAARSEFQPNGANSKKEFGALANAEEAQGLIDMDAYLKIKDNIEYPAIYSFVGLEDGMVAAWDSGKFVARLQQDAITKGPVLLEVNQEVGHGGGTRHDSYQIMSNMDSFILWQTGHPDYQLNDD